MLSGGRGGAGGLCSVGACAPGRALLSVPMDRHVAMAPLRTASDTPKEGVKMLLSVPFCLLTKGLPVDPQSLSTGCVSLSQMKRSNQ